MTLQDNMMPLTRQENIMTSALQENINTAGGTLQTTTETVDGTHEWVVCLRRGDGRLYTLTRGRFSPGDTQRIHDAQARILRLWAKTREMETREMETREMETREMETREMETREAAA